jgi:hypothetical protein
MHPEHVYKHSILICVFMHFRYSFAIVGINLTALSLELLKSGNLKPHLYNITAQKPTLDDFHKVYCKYLLFLGFHSVPMVLSLEQVAFDNDVESISFGQIFYYFKLFFLCNHFEQ